MQGSVRVLAGVLALFLMGARPLPSPVGLADHRALYRISLDHATPSSTVQGITGEMLLEVRSTCEGSKVTQMLKTRFWDDDGAPQNGKMTSTSLEAQDGRSFRFDFNNRINGQVVAAFQGKAERNLKSAEGAITYEKKAFRPAVLPADSVFPVDYMQELLKTAAEAGRVLGVVIFDGSEDAKIFRSTAIIGKREEGGEVPDEALAGMVHWPVVTSYRRLESKDPYPDYESSFQLYANGVTDRVVMDYGDFAMKGDLTSLELLPSADCGEN